MGVFRFILGVLLSLLVIKGKAQFDSETTALLSSDGTTIAQLESSRVTSADTTSSLLQASTTVFNVGSQTTDLQPSNNIDSSLTIELSITPQLSTTVTKSNDLAIPTSTEQRVDSQYTSTPILENVDSSSRIESSITSQLSESVTSKSGLEIATSSHGPDTSTAVRDPASSPPVSEGIISNTAVGITESLIGSESSTAVQISESLDGSESSTTIQISESLVGSESSTAVQISESLIGSESSTTVQISESLIGSESSTTVQISESLIGSESSTAVQISESLIGSESSTTVQISESQIGSEFSTAVQISESLIGSESSTTVQISESQIGSEFSTAVQISESLIGSESSTTVQILESQIGSESSTAVQISESLIGSESNTAVQISESLIGSESSTTVQILESQIGSESSTAVQISESLIGSESSTAVQISESLIGSESSTTVQISESQIGSESSTAVQISESLIGSESNTAVQISESLIGSESSTTVQTLPQTVSDGVSMTAIEPTESVTVSESSTEVAIPVESVTVSASSTPFDTTESVTSSETRTPFDTTELVISSDFNIQSSTYETVTSSSNLLTENDGFFSSLATSTPDYSGEIPGTSSTSSVPVESSSSNQGSASQTSVNSILSQSENFLQTTQLDTSSASFQDIFSSSEILLGTTDSGTDFYSSQVISVSQITDPSPFFPTSDTVDTQTQTLIYPTKTSSLTDEATTSVRDISSVSEIVTNIYESEDVSSSLAALFPSDSSSIQDFASTTTFQTSSRAISQATYQTQIPANTILSSSMQQSNVVVSSELVIGEDSSVVFSSVQSSIQAISSSQELGNIVTSDQSTVSDFTQSDYTMSTNSVIQSNTVSSSVLDNVFSATTEETFVSSQESVIISSLSLEVISSSQTLSLSDVQSKGSSMFNEQSSAVQAPDISPSAFYQSVSISDSLELYPSEITSSTSQVMTESIFSTESISSVQISEVFSYPSGSQSQSALLEPSSLSERVEVSLTTVEGSSALLESLSSTSDSTVLTDMPPWSMSSISASVASTYQETYSVQESVSSLATQILTATAVDQSFSESGGLSDSFESSFRIPSVSFQAHETDIIFTYTLSVTAPVTDSGQKSSSELFLTSAYEPSFTDTWILDSNTVGTESLASAFQSVSSATASALPPVILESSSLDGFISSSVSASDYLYPSGSDMFDTSSTMSGSLFVQTSQLLSSDISGIQMSTFIWTSQSESPSALTTPSLIIPELTSGSLSMINESDSMIFESSLTSELSTPPVVVLPTITQSTSQSIDASFESAPTATPSSQTISITSDQSAVTQSVPAGYESSDGYTLTPTLSSLEESLDYLFSSITAPVFSDISSRWTLQSSLEETSAILTTDSLTSFGPVFPPVTRSVSSSDIPSMVVTMTLSPSASDILTMPSSVIYDISSVTFPEESNSTFVDITNPSSVLISQSAAATSIFFPVGSTSVFYSNSSDDGVFIPSSTAESSMSAFPPISPSESDIVWTSTETLQTASSTSGVVIPIPTTMSLESIFTTSGVEYDTMSLESPFTASGVKSEITSFESKFTASGFESATMSLESRFTASGFESAVSSATESVVILPSVSFMTSSISSGFYPLPPSQSLESSFYASTGLSLAPSSLGSQGSGSLQSSDIYISFISSDVTSTDKFELSTFVFPTSSSESELTTTSFESLFTMFTTSGVESMVSSSSEPIIILPTLSPMPSSDLSSFYPLPPSWSQDSSLYASTGLSFETSSLGSQYSGSLQTSSYYLSLGSSYVKSIGISEISTFIFPTSSSESAVVVLPTKSLLSDLSSSYLESSLTTGPTFPETSSVFSDISSVKSDLSSVPETLYSSYTPVLPTDIPYSTSPGVVTLDSRSSTETLIQSEQSTFVPDFMTTIDSSMSTQGYSSVISSESDRGSVIFTSSVSMETSTSVQSGSYSSMIVETSMSIPVGSESDTVVPSSTESVSSSVTEPITSVMPASTSTSTSTLMPTPTQSFFLSSSVLPTEPPTVPPTTPSLNTSEALKEFWVVTVIKVRRSEDVTTEAFKSNIQSKLASVYQDAFTRQELIKNGTYLPLKRRKRYATSPDGSIQLQVVNVERETGSSDTKLTYLAEKDGKMVPANTMVSTLGLLYDQEVALGLGYVVSTTAEPYVPVPVTPTEDRKLWIIAAVLGPLVLLLIIWIVVCLICRFCCNRKNSGDAEEPHLMKVRRDGNQVESDFGGSDAPHDYPPEQGNQRSNGVGLVKSGTKKMSYDVNPDPDDESALYAEVKKPVEAAKIPKKKKHPSPSHQSNTGDSMVYVSEDDHQGTPAKRKGRKQKHAQPGADDSSVQIENMVEPHYHEPRSKPLPIPRAVKSQQSGVPPTPEEEEELVERTELERLKNKQRLREQRKRDKLNNSGSTRSRDHDMKKAQKEIDAVLGSPENEEHLPDVFVHKPKKRSTRRGREPKEGHANEAFTEDEQEASSQSGESLEEAKRRMHRLLDDAFSLISSSRSSIGNKVTPMTSPKRGSRLPPPEGHRKDESTEATPRPNGHIPAESRESKPHEEEKKHTPMFFNPTFSGKDNTGSGLETWSPYRAADEVALISLPQTQTVLDKTPTQERLQTTTFTESYPTSMRDSYYTTEPAKPIVIRSKDLFPDSQETTNSIKPSNTKHQTVNGIGTLAGSGGLPNGDASYPGMKGYEDIPLHSVSGKSHTQEPRRENGDVPHRAPVKTWAGQDEVDIVSSLDPGASPRPFIRSLREELEHLSTRVGDVPPGTDSKGNALS